MTPEWITKIAQRICDQAEPQLQEISKQAAERHGAAQLTLSQTDVIRVATLLAEVQDASFKLGLRMALEFLSQIAREAVH